MPVFRRVFFLIALAVLLAAPLLRVRAGSAPVAGATFTHGNLALTLPYHDGRGGAGVLLVEILDPEDRTLARVERRVEIGKGDGAWQQTVTPAKPIAYEEIVWQRVRYRFTYDGGGEPVEAIEPISAILRRPVVRVLGQTEYLAGSQAAIRVLVADATSNDAAQTGTLRIELADDKGEGPRTLFSGRLDRRGTVEAQLRFPAGVTGPHTLRFTAETPIGTAESVQNIQLADKAAILLTTEKPLYQPGQTIHVRALALGRASHTATARRPLTFVLEDARGNRVFRKPTETDTFGIASAEFALADEVNLGAWHLKALMGDAEAPSSDAELTLNVQRYVLPKFKVAVDFAQANGKPKRDYRPGEHVVGTVHANYFFGKPVDRAEITVKASAADVQVFEAASSTGKTDAEGVFHFDLKLPGYFAGKPLAQGAARALVEATVRDSAQHAETRGEAITVSQTALLVTAVPEGGSLVRGVENQVYLVAAYPDGTPATNAALTVGARHLTADASGVAVLHLAANEQPGTLRIVADDHHGNRAELDAPLALREGADQVLLRTSAAVVKAGDRITATVLSTRSTGTVYVDIVRNDQTILTRDLDLRNGQATLNLTATPEMAGTLDLNAYVFGRDAQPVADHRLLFVQPAGELKIEATTNAAVFRPGSEARIRFHVTNGHGEGVSAALGLQIVDEAVFALAEKQPGFAKVFFYLEQEVMKPRYEIHSLSIPGVIGSGGQGDDLAAQALFAATEIAAPKKLDVEFGRTLPQDRHWEFQQRYQAAFRTQVEALVRHLNGHAAEDLTHSAAVFNAPRDSWGRAFRVDPMNAWGRAGSQQYYNVRSAGPDGRFNTADDLAVMIQRVAGTVVAPPSSERGGHFDLQVEHDRGPSNGRAEIAGTAIDQTGAKIPGAQVELHDAAQKGSVRKATCDANGSFTLSSLPPGSYELRMQASGFKTLIASVKVDARDRAVLRGTLEIGSTTQTVTVAQPQFTLASPAPRGRVHGVINGGIAGGIGMAAAPMQQAFVADGVEAQNVTVETAAALPIEGRSVMFKRKEPAPAAAAATEAHVRSWFPEALYINPEILTDGHGNAEITIPVADSITTWRMAMMASTTGGLLGSGTSSLKVFQDFFVDLDLPVTLTQGDRVSLPVAIYNYAGRRGEVALSLEPDAWYTLAGDDPRKTVAVEADHVGAAQYTLTANRIGKFKLTLKAHMEGRDDIVVREIEVIPNGRESNVVVNGRLGTTAAHDLRFPADALPDATTLFVRLYPGPLSQVVEGMDAILRMPYGCFEQTSSSTYPNVLALDYMKRTGKLTPEVHARAEGFIANGYQRLLTFEVPGGGFSWFGQVPANKILTAYGLMEFSDMAKVSSVDPRLIERTRDWLVRQQQPDGSWKADTQFINEGATNRFNTDVPRITAYLAWALTDAGYRGPALDKARRYLEAHPDGKPDAYTLAVIASFAAELSAANPDARGFADAAMKALLDARTEKGEEVYWESAGTGFYATGTSASVETTGLAVQALLRWGQAPATVRKALGYLAAKKQARGTWATTQATIMALRALLMASEHGTANTHGTVEVLLDGKVAETLQVTKDNNDLLHQFVFKGIDAGKGAHVELRFQGSGTMAYQVVGRYFTPWEAKPAAEALAIDVAYDRTTLAENDLATATATVTNNTGKTANMIMVDLGIPPGFDLLSEDLQEMVEQTTHARTGKLEKFSQTATQAILYFNALAPGQTIKVRFRLRAKYPIKAKTFQSRVYEYYDPEVKAVARPVQLEVRGR